MSHVAAVAQRLQSSAVLHAVIFAQGMLTVWLAFAFLPLGVVATLVNTVLAFTSHVWRTAQT